jgi:alkanesulfonate monooxygenase SsuD/methylene tetrahydromethanopterin reductase-like flavin-dependent oxidoreductase (luciferase family)
VAAVSDRTGVLFSRIDDPEIVALTEELGYESVWSAEGQGTSAFGKLERWAAVTDEIGLATGIVNVFSRTPAALAQSLATLDEHSGGRAIGGFGVAHPGVVEDFHGAEFERPLARMHEYITLVRRYLAGEASGFDGDFYSPARTSFWAVFEPERAEIPIYNAALGPANVRLTGQVADGWLPNLFPDAKLQEALGWLETGAERANRSVKDIDVAMYILVTVADDEGTAYQEAGEHIALYLRDIPGYYGRMAEEAGFEEEIERAREAPSLAAGADELPRELLDMLAIAGTPEQVRAGLDDLRDAGVDLPIVRAPVDATPADHERLVRTCAPE